ncbi:DUF2169 domain-containing protein [Caballeronia sp. ATUFL_F2_KS9A]|uniref:DUF2169 family type VI secretion system accessory protein n=1 Tax=Caballeronia sp. ATUFL_F2_KS9A TaxID=2921777 RepID=UPI002028593E|nr:DUF2169 domain-containing protein [Caballeronia sp. ATUFL_F2_KS9A]
MWSIENRTAYEVDTSWTRDKEGTHEWIVAVKATYDITPAGPRLADEQTPPVETAEYTGTPGRSSLRYDSDLLGPKPTTDIVLNGTAYAPGGRPSDDFLVGMRVGPVRKTLRVRGHRKWGKGMPGRMLAEPVVRLPVIYELAYGGYDAPGDDPARHGYDARNPVGRGVVGAGQSREGMAMPNFEYPSGRLDKDGPAGFGAIDSFWSPRRERAGTYDDAWMRDRSPLLPEDWSPHSLQCAPPDQQPASPLQGGEPVELINLTPAGSMSFALPKVRLAFTTRIDTRDEEHRARLSSVILEPDALRLMLVWVTVLKVEDEPDYLESTLVREKDYLS